MNLGLLLLFGMAMAIGLVGVLVPVLPGLLLIAAAGLGWAVLADGPGPWVVFGAMIVVLAVGTVAKYVLPGRTLRQAGAPVSTLLLSVLGAVIGFFVIPVIGFLLGAVAGIFLGELRRLNDSRAAGRSTVTTLKAIGIGLAIELLAGVLAVAIWFVAVIAGLS